jgi:hypothetical protein
VITLPSLIVSKRAGAFGWALNEAPAWRYVYRRGTKKVGQQSAVVVVKRGFPWGKPSGG